MSRLGIIDWGIGGVSIYKPIKERLPGVAVTYFSDTGVTPYGKMSRTELTSRLNSVIAFLRDRSVTQVVIGCNAASTAIDDLEDHRIPVFGVIEPAIRMIATIKPRRLGLIGGRRTVLSGIHRRALAKRGLTVAQRIAQPLSAMIETGDISSDGLHAEVRRILAPLKQCSHILLACTHYPAIMPVLRQHAPKVTFLDPAGELVDSLARHSIDANGGGDEFLTTGDSRAMKRSAWNAFGLKIGSAARVSL